MWEHTNTHPSTQANKQTNMTWDELYDSRINTQTDRETDNSTKKQNPLTHMLKWIHKFFLTKLGVERTVRRRFIMGRIL